MSINRKYPTGYQKRTLTYNPSKQSILELPEKYYNKISNAEFKKVKQAYFVMASSNYMLNYDSFIKTMRSLGIVVRTSTLYEAYWEKKDSEKNLNWETFLEIYISLRNYKGSFKEVDTAVNLLNKQYNGRWQLLFKDLKELGDVLSEQDLQIFKNEIMGNQIINSENLKNSLLGYK